MGKDGELYPPNLNNNYVSQLADGFDDCLRYGSTQHWFRSYPHKDKQALKIIFW